MPGEYAVADVQACNVLVPNVLQKAVFRRAKRGLSPCDWWHIASRKAANCGSSANLLDGTQKSILSPKGGKLRLTAGGVSAANVTCGKSKLLQLSPKGANGVLGYAVAGSYGYAVCPYTPITV